MFDNMVDLTASSTLTNSSGFDPGTTDGAGAETLFPSPDGNSSEARWTKPSRKAYSESRNAFVILVTNSEAIGFCCFAREDDDADDERSTPPAILNAAVVICLW